MERKTRQRKRIYANERRQWLDDFESGMSVAAIAKETGRNPNTIKSHIQAAREEKEQARARTELYRDALFQHNQDLLRIIGIVQEGLHVPPDERFTVLADFSGEHGMSLPVSVAFEDGAIYVRPAGGIDGDRRLLELVRQHLSQDRRMWKCLDDWFEELAKYANACLKLGRKIGEEVRGRRGMELTPSRLAGTTGGVEVHEGFVTWVGRLALEARVPEEPVIVGSQMRYGGTHIATSPDETALEDARSAFVSWADELARDNDLRAPARLRRGLNTDAHDLKRDLGDILLTYFVPGRCDVCKKLGR